MDSFQHLDGEWLRSWKRKVEGSSSNHGQLRACTATIFRVSEHIRETDPKAYEPKVVSIGPYHHNKPHLKAMEQVKLLYFKRFLLCHPGNSLEDYLHLINRLVHRCRCCYFEEVAMNENEFKDMLLLDGCFIIELFLSKMRNAWQAADPILGNMLTLSLVEFDMLLLENQLPFFLIESLFKLLADIERDVSLLEIVVSFFDGILPSCKNTMPVVTFDHFLHLFHSTFIANPPEAEQLQKIQENYSVHQSADGNPGATKAMLMTPCAADLMNANVKIRREPGESFNWHIDFRQRVIKIFPARLNSNSNSFYRNLIAFEQYCFPKVWSRVMAYVMFMSCLINSENDLVLLRRERIVEYTLDCHEAALFFRNLCKDSMVDYDKAYLSHLDDLSMKVWECYDTAWNRYKAVLKSSYFSNPVNIIYLIASVIFVIVLTVLQTVYTVLSYYNSKK